MKKDGNGGTSRSRSMAEIIAGTNLAGIFTKIHFPKTTPPAPKRNPKMGMPFYLAMSILYCQTSCILLA